MTIVGGGTSALRQITGVLPGALLSYVRRQHGEDGLARVLGLAKFGPTPAELEHPGRWYTHEEVIALAEASSEVCGDNEMGRRTGEELFRMHDDAGVTDFFRGLGTISAAFGIIVPEGTKMSTGRKLEILEGGESHVIVQGTYSAPHHPFYCGIAAGYYSCVPGVFGARGSVSETSCETRGDQHCRYRVVWDWPVAAGTTTEEIEASRARSDRALQRFEQLLSMASDLTSADDVGTLLDRITRQAATALEAPSYILAVRVSDDSPTRIHHHGFTEAEVARVAGILLEGAPGALGEGAVVVDVASAERRYGRMAALLPRGAVVSDIDRRLLSAYAGYALAALEKVSSLDQARRDRDTATALLDLAAALARVGTRDEVAQRLVDAVPAVTGADHATVWTWDHETAVLRQVAVRDSRGFGDVGDTLTAQLIPGLSGMAHDPQPFVIETTTMCPELSRRMKALSLDHGVGVPIIARDEFLGIVTAGFRQPRCSDADRDLMARLAGLADQAGTAFDNARLLDHIRHQALHDALTGLPNRPLIEDRAAQALRSAARNDGHVSVLFVDLDRFKIVNDTLGHHAGDDLIRQVTRRLESCMRSADTLARLGGDEFLVLLPSDSPEAAARVAERLIAALAEPFQLGAQEVFVSCSIGIATSPDHGRDYTTLMQHADRAMYEAKAQGRGTYAVHADHPRSPRRQRLELESALHKAVENDELVLQYQPQVDLHTMRVVGVEALVRWDHPDLGRIAPDVFIPLAEDSGVIVDIDRWVRRTAFAQARRWIDAGVPPMRMAVNLSTRELRTPRLVDDVAGAIRQHGLDPALVELEITDRVVMSDEDLPTVLEELRSVGVRLAIDDFGTGNSVLGRIQRCPVDTLKIDKSFVQEIRSSADDAPVVSALLTMAHSLRLDVVAEGVETAVQGGILRSLGCSVAQGFFFSRPTEPENVEKLVRSTM